MHVPDANQFLAAFIAGATIATINPGASNSFRHTGELISEMVKGAALLAFAMLLDARRLRRRRLGRPGARGRA